MQFALVPGCHEGLLVFLCFPALVIVVCVSLRAYSGHMWLWLLTRASYRIGSNSDKSRDRSTQSRDSSTTVSRPTAFLSRFCVGSISVCVHVTAVHCSHMMLRLSRCLGTIALKDPLAWRRLEPCWLQRVIQCLLLGRPWRARVDRGLCGLPSSSDF